MKKKYDWLAAVVTQLKGAHIHYKKEWQADQFLITDKMFAMLETNNLDQAIITTKSEQDHNRAMVEMYNCVTEGYYANKIHWISIRLDNPNTLSQEMVIDLLKKSYQLVFNKLPKKSPIQNYTIKIARDCGLALKQ